MSGRRVRWMVRLGTGNSKSNRRSLRDDKQKDKNRSEMQDVILDGSGIFTDYPGGHAALVLDDGCLDGVDELAAEGCGSVEEKGLVDEVTLFAVG